MNSLRTIRPLLTSLFLNALLLAALLFTVLFLATTASAQIPDTLKHSVPPPFGLAESGTLLGTRVAVDGALTVLSGRDTDTSGLGIVDVFDTNTGALLYRLQNPQPNSYWRFGHSVAISGTRVAVWAELRNGASAGSTFIFDLASASPTVPAVKLDNPNPNIGDLNLSVVAISGTRVVVGTPFENTGATRAGSAYVFDLASASPGVPVATLHNPAPGIDDHFGYSVAVSGARVVVGAPLDNAALTDDGSAYVYDLAGATPTVPTVSLHDPSPHARDGFGTSVAISGSRLVVGTSDGYTDITGAAYAYDLASATPTLPVSLNNPNPQPNALFGASVGISGTRVIVGIPNYSFVVDAVGRACVYDLAGATPSVPIAVLEEPTTQAVARFGTSVAASGARVVVGSPYYNATAYDSGRACVYDFTGTPPTLPAVVLIDNRPSLNDQFGNAIAVSGARLVIAARGGDGAGRADVYDLAGPTPTLPIATFNNPNPYLNYDFAHAVAISGTRVIVGTPYTFDNIGVDTSGAVYVYDLAAATPSIPVLTLHPPGPAARDAFGYSLAIAGTRLIVGAPEEDTGAADAGSAYVYDLASAIPNVPVAILHNPTPAASDSFGYAVAISGARLVVATPYDSNDANTAGIAYVYDLASATPAAPAITLHNPELGTNFYYGTSVAISGPRVIVGDAIAGVAYVYNIDGKTPGTPTVTIHKPPNSGEQFGYAVAISGTRAVLSDPLSDSLVGRIHVYDLASAAPDTPVVTLNNPNPAFQGEFGLAVAIDALTIAVGAPFDGTLAYQKGYAHVFRPASNDIDNNGLLDLWEYAHFGTATGHFALGDDDHDGLNNLFEEAFNADPLKPDSAAVPIAVNEGGYLTMTIAKRAGVIYQVQSAATPDPAAFSAATTTVLINNAATLKVRDNFPIATNPGRFLRVKVTTAP